MTELLSHSITNSEKPASTANLIAFLQASSSASILQDTFGPLAAMAAITSLSSLRMIAPNPDLLRPEKIAASKLSLKTNYGGSCQVSQGCCLAESVPI